jgi:signal transduction histidine kinase
VTKKKINVLIVLGTLVMYLICTGVAYSGARSYVDSHFVNESSLAESNLGDYLWNENLKDLGDNPIGTVTENIEDILTDYYPYAFAIYDSNNKVVAHSGEYIVFDDNYINISEYMTEDILKQISDNYGQYLAVIYQMNYNIEDGKILPTTLALVNPNDGKKIKLKLRESTSKEYTAYSSDADDVDDDDLIRYIYFDYHTAYMSKTDKKIWDELQDYVCDLDKLDKTFVADTGGGYSGPDSLEYNYSFRIDGDVYFLEFKMEHNGFYDAINSTQFKSEMIMQTALFVIVLIAILIISNKLYDKNKKLNESKTAFVSAAAHELKTPLAVIQNQCECIIENIAPEKNEQYVKSIYDESLRMNKLVATLLQHNRLATADKITKSDCSLSKIAIEEVDKYMPLINEKGIVFSNQIQDDVTINANADLIALVIDNFLSNAVKHTKEGNHIEVLLSNDGKLVVFNEGMQIIDGDKLWDVFYRDDKVRNSKDNSTGMGLAICKQILTLHKYKFGIENKSNGVAFYFIAK